MRGGRGGVVPPVEHRWKKGDPSPNPSGGPKLKPFADACRELGAMSPAEVAALDPMTVETVEKAEALLAHRELLRGRRMPVKLLREIKDRSEGPVLRRDDEDPAAAAFRRDPERHAVLVVNIFGKMGAEQEDIRAAASLLLRARDLSATDRENASRLRPVAPQGANGNGDGHP